METMVFGKLVAKAVLKKSPTSLHSEEVTSF
jgi:hypothetical protein